MVVAAPVLGPSGVLATNPGAPYCLAVLCYALVQQAGAGAGTLARKWTLLALVTWQRGSSARGVQVEGEVAWI